MSDNRFSGPLFYQPIDEEIERERQRRQRQDAEPPCLNPPPATVNALLSECERHRACILTAMKEGQKFHAYTDANFAALVKGRITGFLLPPLERLWHAATALDLPCVPLFPGEPVKALDAVTLLDVLIAWIRSQRQTASIAAAGLEGQPPAVQQAWSQYQGVIDARPDLGDRGTDRELYDYLKGTLAGESDGVRLPAFDTWQ